jgi:hypothetical protein
MAMTFTVREVEHSAFVLLIDDDGNYRWSSDKPLHLIADALEHIAEECRTDTVTTSEKD